MCVSSPSSISTPLLLPISQTFRILVIPFHSFSGIKCLCILYGACGQSPDLVVTVRGVAAVLFWPQVQEQSSEATPESSVSIEVVDKSLQDGEAASKVSDLLTLINIFTLTNKNSTVLQFILCVFHKFEGLLPGILF